MLGWMAWECRLGRNYDNFNRSSAPAFQIINDCSGISPLLRVAFLTPRAFRFHCDNCWRFGCCQCASCRKFDCIILTQNLQYIYNLDNAMENLYCALAPGGSLLITVPGISPINRHEMKYWYWAFTELSLKTLLSKRFGENNVEVQSYGNVFAAVSFLTGLTGLSLSKVETEKLDYKDKKPNLSS